MKKKKRKSKIRGYIWSVIPLFIVLCLLSRLVPDGTVRLNLGKSGVGEKAIAITFDDGPTQYTDKLLDGLSKYNAQVSFFVLGTNAEKYPEIILKAYEEGHLIGNHTYDHEDMVFSSTSTIKESIKKTDDIIHSITGKSPLFFRPSGDYISFIKLKTLDTFIIQWSYDIKDMGGQSADYIYRQIMNGAKDGAIIRLHDTNPSTVEAVLKAVPELLEDGYELVRVDDLLSRNDDKIKRGIPYRSCEYKEVVRVLTK